MRRALISVDKKTELTAYCRQLQEIALRIEELNRIDNARVPRRGRPAMLEVRESWEGLGMKTAMPPTRPPVFTPQKAMPQAPDAMDWAPAGADINAVKPLVLEQVRR